MDERQDYADAFMAAARRLGAIPFQVRLPEASSTLTGDAGAWTVGVTPLGDNRPAIDALKQADLVIDLMFLLFSREQMEIQAAERACCSASSRSTTSPASSRPLDQRGASRPARSCWPPPRRSASRTRRAPM